LRTGIAHATHLGGYLAGYLYLYQLPRLNAWLKARESAQRETRIRETVESGFAKKRYYQDQIDPILKKISEQGIESLTDFERHVLKKAGK